MMGPMRSLDPAAMKFARALTSPSAVEMAIRDVAAGRVRIDHDLREYGVVEVLATVRASDGTFGASVSWDEDDPDWISTWCSCGYPECRHVAAAVLASQGPNLTPLPALPSWQRELDRLLPATPVSATREVCLFLGIREETRRSPYDRRAVDARVMARPGTRGVRGNWIQGDADWSQLGQLGAEPGVVDLLVELSTLQSPDAYTYGYHGRREQWIALDDVPSRGLWTLLAELADRLPVITPGKRQLPVVVESEAAHGQMAVHSGPDGALVLRGHLEVDGVPIAHPHFIGEPAVGFAREVDGALVLTPLAEPLTARARALLTHHDPIRVDPGTVDAFERDYLPQLQRLLPVHSPDASYRVPEPVQSALVLNVVHTDTQTHLSWSWDRGAAVVIDREHERAVLGVVRAACGTRAEATLGAADRLVPVDRTLVRSEAVLFLAEVLPPLRELDHVRVDDSAALMPAYQAALEPPVVRVGTKRAGATDWFDLFVTVTVAGEEVDFAQLFTALSLGEPLFVLPSGTYFALDAPEFDMLRAILDEARALSDRPVDDLRISRYQVDLWSELTRLGIVQEQEHQWWQTVRGLSDIAELEPAEPPVGLSAELREYQRDGLSWLHFLRRHGLGGVLADDMGLGKTLQTIAMIQAHHEEADHAVAPYLIVAPTSVVGNWAAECARFAPGLRVAAIDATQARRGVPLTEIARGADVVVTSYALFRLEFDAYETLDWSGLILDEAQLIKNHASRGYACARRLNAPFKLVITGTPLENNTLELWALTSLACPGLLGDKASFVDHFRHPIEREQNAERLATLKRRLRPFMLRRTKELVAADLPAKQEQIVELDLHPTHKTLYDRRFQRERQKILGLVGDIDANRFQIFRSLTLLRQLALDPELTDEGAAPSAKLEALRDLLVEAAAEGHRVVVFSQFTRFLSKARDVAERAGLHSVYLDGTTTKRQQVIDEFRTGDASVFFVSLKAGGFGLNLVEADYVVLLDPWWNPATEAQAIDRTHRIGQTKPVFVYRLVSKNTIESKVMALKEAKSQLFARVLDAEGAVGGGTLTAADIRALVE